MVISQDLDELLALCDTLAVINEGRLSDPMPVQGADIEKIGLLMGGEPRQTPEHGQFAGGRAAALLH